MDAKLEFLMPGAQDDWVEVNAINAIADLPVEVLSPRSIPMKILVPNEDGSTASYDVEMSPGYDLETVIIKPKKTCN